jgi:membrane associated rhomboid family serine protease
MLEEFKHAFQRHNNAHVQLIFINVAIFMGLGVLYVVAKMSHTPLIFTIVYDQFTLPSDLSEYVFRPWSLITYGFAHHYNYEFGQVGIFHIFFNMLGFYWFGRLFVEYLGSDKLVALYVLGVLAGGLSYLLIYNTLGGYSPDIFHQGSTLVGASAAVYAVMTAVAVLLPDYSFHLLLFGPVKIKYIAAVYIAISFLSSVGANAGGEIAHLGGALIGFVYIKQLQAGSNWGNWITMTIYWFKGLFKPRMRVKVSYRNKEYEQYKKATEHKGSNISQAEIDAILDKISAGGYESLTKDEKEKLFNASKK